LALGWALLAIYTLVPSRLIIKSIFCILFFGAGFSFIVNQIITLVVVLLGALFVNFLVIEQEITSKTNYLPAFFYILFSFSATTKSAVEPILVANLFVIPALYFLINSYRKDYALMDVFKSGIFMGLASFFCIHYISAFPLMFIALFILRPFNWREWSIMFIGLVTPLYIYVSICYLTTNDAFVVFEMIKEATSSLQKLIISEYYLAFILMSGLTLVFALFHYFSKGFGGKVKTQKTKYVLLWMLLFCLLMVFFEQVSDMILLPCIIPLSIFIGDYLSELKQLKIANTIMVLFIGSFSLIYLHAIGVI
jgi:ABC-type multidrug transport system fused ATPase/permease subunit